MNAGNIIQRIWSQNLAMFKYVCHKAGIDFAKLKVIGVGGAEEMDKAFRDGKGQYVQQQGPFPGQLEADGVGQIVAQCGPKIGPVAFSSLADDGALKPDIRFKAGSRRWWAARVRSKLTQIGRSHSDVIVPS